MILVRLAVWPIVMLIWAVAGFYVWVPGIAVCCVVYLVSVIPAAMTGQAAFISSLENAVSNMIRSYPDGFVNIHRVLFKKPQGAFAGSGRGVLSEFGLFAVAAIGCLFGATLFWVGVAALIDWLG